jgi:glyoxylase-like metal-dependent hydrolase (beta-lactamase superfamily II)
MKSRGKKLKGIFISHYHADYLSGQYQLAKTFKCKIYMGPQSVGADNVANMHDREQI